MLDKAITRRIGIRLIGIGVSKFSSFSEQEFLFESTEIKRKKMLRAVNKLRKIRIRNNRCGKGLR
jgi:hypothetical protein